MYDIYDRLYMLACGKSVGTHVISIYIYMCIYIYMYACMLVLVAQAIVCIESHTKENGKTTGGWVVPDTLLYMVAYALHTKLTCT